MGHMIVVGEGLFDDKHFITRGDQVFELLPDDSEVELDEQAQYERGFLHGDPIQEAEVSVSGLARLTNWLRGKSQG
jgi:hypothetical protein